MSAKKLRTQQEPKQQNLQTADDTKDSAKILKSEYGEFSGPIPPPGILAEYNERFPGFAERILTMAENQSNHRMEAEMMMIKSESDQMKRGSWFAFLLGVSAVGAAVAMAYIEHGAAGVIAGAVLGVSGISSIAINFIKRIKE